MSQAKTWTGLAALLAVVLVAGAWFGLISPVLASTADTRDAVLNADAQTDTLTLELANLKKQYEDLDTYRAELSALEAQIPSTAAMADYRSALAAAASESGVTILMVSTGAPALSDVTPAPVAAESTDAGTGDGADAASADAAARTATPASSAEARLVGIPLSVTVLGTYANSMSFLDKVQNQIGRLMLVSSISTTSQTDTPASGGKPATAKGDLELSLDGFVMVLPPAGTAPVPDDTGDTVEEMPSSERNPFVPVGGAASALTLYDRARGERQDHGRHRGPCRAPCEDVRTTSERGRSHVLRWLTSGESHGPALVGIVEGVPAGVAVSSGDIQAALARRRLGHGRGARMSFEADEVRILAGVRHGRTQGGPIAIEIANSEWPKWVDVMAADPVDDPAKLERARNAPLTRPRPGHADLVGMRKYGFDDARPVLERASARETATRVALGAVAAAFLAQSVGIRLVSHTVAIGGVDVPEDAVLPTPFDVDTLDADPVRCLHVTASQAMVAEIDSTQTAGDTLGGVVEVLAYDVPTGLGSYTHADRRLDARLAGALMGIQAIKAVEIGDGFRSAARRGSQAHDEIERDPDTGHIRRRTNRAGGLEGGMSNGEVVRVRAAMKPISTVPRALATTDVSTGAPASAIHQRSDVCAVPAAGVVAEAMVALVLAEAVLEKFGGDSVVEVERNCRNYLDAIPALQR